MPYPNVTQFQTLDRRARSVLTAAVRTRRVQGRDRRLVVGVRLRRDAARCA